MSESSIVYAKVNDLYSFEISPDDIEQLEILQLDKNGAGIRYLNKNYNVQIRNQNDDLRSTTIRVDGYDFEINLALPLDRLIEELGFDARKSINSKEVRAPIPGQVIAIYSESGDTILAETPLISLEAMKMENIVQVPVDGTIDNIYVKIGETVKKGQLIASMI